MDRPKTCKPHRRLEIFRHKDATHLDDATMHYAPMDEETLAGMQKVAAVGAQEGLAEKTLVLFKEPRPDGMSIMYAWFKSNYVLPRHNHDADCAYYILAGSLKMGSQTLGKGDGMFVPAGAGYTYEVGPDGLELLEVRNAAHFNIDFKGNNEGHWDRIAEVYRTKRSDWQSETPPSKNVEPA